MAREYDHLFKLLIIGDSGKELRYEKIDVKMVDSGLFLGVYRCKQTFACHITSFSYVWTCLSNQVFYILILYESFEKEHSILFFQVSSVKVDGYNSA